MCGITGYFAFTNNVVDNFSKVKSSTQKLHQRGPDYGDDFVNGDVALGHRRLSIIDTSNAAGQPMKDATGRYVIVFNGEIFNYQELSEKHLASFFAKSGQPKTTSDTEILLYLLINYGKECLQWLNGFFAFAFFDTQEQTMLLARDRYGQKPLNYYHTDEQFAFASELKALFEWGIPKKLNYSVLHQYLQLNYIPQPQSMVEGVAKLKAAHYMLVNKSGIKEYAPYYEISIDKGGYNTYNYQEAQNKLVDLMDTSVKRRMISDVPLGAFLSGGIDSSVIVALASKYTNQLNTFSIGYKDEPFFDETKYAKLVAEKYKTNHTVFSLTNNDFLEHVHDVLDYIDEPFADSSAIPVYILCQHTRKHVTVALSGDAGDEIFAGYNKHAAEWKMRQSSLINNLVKAGYPIWNMLPRSRSNKFTNLFRQLHRFAEGGKLSVKDRYWRWASFNTANKVNNLLSKQSLEKVDTPLMDSERTELLKHLNNGDMNELLLTDMSLVLSGDMLVKVDLMSMASSLEVRSPFLDYEVVDFAFSIPESYKINASMKKRIVQDAFRDMLPEEIYNRPKHGFEIPLLGWFKNELWGYINDDLLEKNFVAEQGIFDVDAIEQLKKKLHSNSPEDSHATIWALIVFQHWWKKYFNN